MTPSELITRVMTYTENIDPQDLDYRPRRRRILAWCQEIWDEVWQASDWPWRRGQITITVATGAYDAALPTDFGNIPSEGGIFNGSLRYEDVSQFYTSAGKQGEFQPPSYSYSLYNYSVTSQRPSIQFPSAGPQTLVMYYNRKPPQLDDQPPVPTLSGGAAGATVHYKITTITEDGYEHQSSNYVSFTVPAGAGNTITLPTTTVMGLSGEHKIIGWNVYRTLSGATPAATYYKVNTTMGLFGLNPTFLDLTTDAGIVSQGTLLEPNVLNQLPPQYHHTVLLPGVISRSRRSKGDTRDWAADYQKGLAKMITQERQRKSSVQRLPRAIMGMW